MTHLPEGQSALLNLLCANHARGLIFSRATRLPPLARRDLTKLRNRGLVAFDRFLPSPSAVATWSAKGPFTSRKLRKAEHVTDAAVRIEADERLSPAPAGTAGTCVEGDAGDRQVPERHDQPAGQDQAAELERLPATDRPVRLGHNRLEASANEQLTTKPSVIATASLLESSNEGGSDVDRSVARADNLLVGATGDTRPWRRKPDAEICAEKLAHEREKERIRATTRVSTAAEAQRILQRTHVVVRANIVGGPKDRWSVRGKSDYLTDAELIEMAEAKLG